jgi:hypothetical protein
MCRVREIGIKISLVITCTLRLNLTEIEIRDKKKQTIGRYTRLTTIITKEIRKRD